MSTTADSPVLRSVDPDDARLLADIEARRAEALDRFKRRYLHNPESQRTMVGALRRLAATYTFGEKTEESFPWEVIIDDDLAADISLSVADGYARRTVQKDASALRVMLECCYRAGLLTREQWRLAASFKAKGGEERPPAGHFLSEEDLVTIIRTCEHGRGGTSTRIRDVALLLTLASSGARGDELTHVPLKDVHLDERSLWLGKTKGSTPRNAWLHPTAVDALERWLTVRGTRPGGLFVPLASSGRPMVDRGHLSTHQVWKTIQCRAAEAGFVGITPHDLRRFLISTLLETVDLTLVAKIVGHKDPATTAGYDRRPAVKQRDAIAGINLPRLSSLVPDVPSRA